MAKLMLSLKHLSIAILHATAYYVGLILSFAVFYGVLFFPLKVASDFLLSQKGQEGAAYYSRSGEPDIFFTLADSIANLLSRYGIFSLLFFALILGYLGTIFFITLILIRTIIIISPGGPIGRNIRKIDCPELFELLDEVSNDLGVRNFDRVYIVPGAEAAAIETSLVPLIPVGRRNLVVGWLLLTMLSKTQLKAVLAHELAHFDNNAFILHRSLKRIQKRIQITLSAIRYFELNSIRQREKTVGQLKDDWTQMSRSTSNIAVLTYLWLSRVMLSLYRFWAYPYFGFLNRSVREISYEFEYYCDRVGGKSYGANSVLDALKIIASAQLIFDNLFTNYQKQIAEAGNGYLLFYEFFESEKQKYAGKEEQMLRPTYTHPSLVDRAQNLNDMLDAWDASPPLIPKINRYQPLEVELTFRMLKFRLM